MSDVVPSRIVDVGSIRGDCCFVCWRPVEDTGNKTGSVRVFGDAETNNAVPIGEVDRSRVDLLGCGVCGWLGLVESTDERRSGSLVVESNV